MPLNLLIEHCLAKYKNDIQILQVTFFKFLKVIRVETGRSSFFVKRDERYTE